MYYVVQDYSCCSCRWHSRETKYDHALEALEERDDSISKYADVNDGVERGFRVVNSDGQIVDYEGGQ